MDVLVVLGTCAAYFYSIIFVVVTPATAGKQGKDNEQFVYNEKYKAWLPSDTSPRHFLDTS